MREMVIKEKLQSNISWMLCLLLLHFFDVWLLEKLSTGYFFCQLFPSFFKINYSNTQSRVYIFQHLFPRGPLSSSERIAGSAAKSVRQVLTGVLLLQLWNELCAEQPASLGPQVNVQETRSQESRVTANGKATDCK